MKNILVLIPVEEKHKELLEGKAPGCKFIFENFKTVSKAQVQEANIIIGNPPVDMLKDSKNLEWLQLQSSGVGEYGQESNLPHNVILTNASGAYGRAISEYMIGVLLVLYKKLYLYRDNQFLANWSYLGPVKTIYGSTALIVGAGNIGGEFAKRLSALGAYTIGIRRTDTSKPDYFDEVHLIDKLDELLPRADIVALSLPGTRRTNKVIDSKRLKLMKSDAVLINVGRGNVVDTEALCDALESGRLLAAALDVTEPEPLPKGHRLWRIKNAIITPHVSGRFSVQEILETIVDISAANLEAFLKGDKLANVVDLEEGY